MTMKTTEAFAEAALAAVRSCSVRVKYWTGLHREGDKIIFFAYTRGHTKYRVTVEEY